MSTQPTQLHLQLALPVGVRVSELFIGCSFFRKQEMDVENVIDIPTVRGQYVSAMHIIF